MTSLTGTDLFTGGGGSCVGAKMVPGFELRFAANHWQKIVDLHARNHPEAAHACCDISQMNPRYAPRTDLLWASPSCTKHTRAQGVRRDLTPLYGGEVSPDEEAAERSRATMFDVPRFAEHHRYRAIIVENVTEVTDWLFYADWWRMMTRSLGYVGRELSINSMHAQHHGPGAPQSRDRWYAVFTRPGDRQPDLEAIQRPTAECERCGTVESVKAWKPGRTRGAYGRQYVFQCSRCHRRVEPAVRGAEEAIDWTLPTPTIGSRKRPLAPATMRRIDATVGRYWATDRPPLIIESRGGGSHGRPASEPLSTISAQGRHHGLLLSYYGASKMGRPTTEPFSTMTTRDRHGLLTRPTTEVIDDLGYRMITPPEQSAGMDFPRDYDWSGLTGTEQTLATGNAVTPPAARDLVWAVAESLGGAA